MKKLKPILIFFSVLSCLVILAFGLWVYQLNQKISDGLVNKRFLPPTEYFAAPEAIAPESAITPQQLLEKLRARKFRERGSEEKVFPGDFQITNLDSCKSQINNIPDQTKTCVIFSNRETWDPTLAAASLQAVIFDSEDKILATFQGNPLLPSVDVRFEPELIAQYLEGQPISQTYHPLGQIPPHCTNAVLAIEDSQFLEHGGVSYTGIARALVNNVFRRGVKQGGSTITQQLVKNYFLTAERTLKRKVTEFVMSFLLEAHSSKDEIMETYLNIIYLGQNGPFQIRGFGAAAQYYFGKSLEALELPDCAMLAAVLNSPGLYDPFRKPENATKRRALVLERMKSLQMISQEEATSANADPLPRARGYNVTETAPYYLNMVNREVEKMGLDLLGLKIYTGLVVRDQQAAQEAVRNHLDFLEKQNPKIKSLKEKGHVLEGLLISASNETGLVTAVVGGRSFRLTQFNRAVDGHRQVGSIMKPIVFLTALLQSGESNQSYDPSTILHDQRFTYEYQNQSWSPENYSKKYYGDVPMYFALKNSLNAATAKLGIDIGLEKIINTARQLGITSQLAAVPALTLGAFELYPLEILGAYATIARMGNQLQPSTVRAIADKDGRALYLRELKQEQKIPSGSVASLVSMMQQTVQSGTAQSISQGGFHRPAAGKTGTTSDNKDSWFAGFTPQRTTLAWTGYDTPTANGLTGASGAIPIWLAFMKNATESEPEKDFPWPDSVTPREVQFSEENVSLMFAN